jgi:hypothetical protein
MRASNHQAEARPDAVEGLLIARLAAYHAVHLLDHGLPCDAELMNAKLTNVEYALDSARNAMEVHAACGLFADRPIERFVRDAHHIFAPAGTSDIQLLRLAEFALGTSKIQWSQRLAASAGSQAYRQSGCPVSLPHSPASCDAAKGDRPKQRKVSADAHVNAPLRVPSYNDTEGQDPGCADCGSNEHARPAVTNVS